MIRKSTSEIIYPKFPVKAKPQKYEKWGKIVKKIIENKINSDSKVMGFDLSYWFDIRPLLEALK